MSRIIICDKCGVHLNPCDIYSVRIQHNSDEESSVGMSVLTYDLCKNCYVKFSKWMKSKEDKPEKIDTPVIVEGESKSSNELAIPDDAPDYCDCRRMDYAGYSSHDAESHYRCPICGDDYGSWSFLHMKMYNTVGGKIFQCTECKTWLRCPK